MSENNKVCHSTECPNYIRMKEDIDKLEKDLGEFKAFTYNKFDEIRNAYNDIKERTIRMETLFLEKFNQIEKIIANKQENNKNIWLTVLSNLVSPLMVAGIMWLIMK